MSELLPLAQAGNVDAQVLVGKMYMLGQETPKDTELALRWFQSASEQGNAEAEFVLGAMYLLPKRDVSQGLKWIRLSADQGTGEAQLLLGMAYLKGSDLPRDLVQADMWLRLAATQGDKFAASQSERAETEMTTNQIQNARALAAAWKPSSLRREGVQRPPYANNLRKNREPSTTEKPTQSHPRTPEKCENRLLGPTIYSPGIVGRQECYFLMNRLF